jgi:hypothetical protein
MALKLAGLLQEQMDNVLDRIDEDEEIDEEYKSGDFSGEKTIEDQKHTLNTYESFE